MSLPQLSPAVSSVLKRMFGLVALIALIFAVPLTVIVSQNQQNLRQDASGETTYKAFVSSSTHNGNLGGIEGADAICNQLATQASLPGQWVAFLSDSTIDAKDRILEGKYVRVDGQTIADNKTELVNQNLKVPLNISEAGSVVANLNFIWTGTQVGGVKSTNTCNNWQTGGQLGQSGHSDAVWSSTQTDCSGFTNNLYCFQVSTGASPTPTPTPSPALTSTPSPTPTGCNAASNKPGGCACVNSNQCASNGCEKADGSQTRTCGTLAPTHPPATNCSAATNKGSGCACRKHDECAAAVCGKAPGSNEKVCLGQTITSSPADINRKGCVDVTDFAIWLKAFQTNSIEEDTFPNVNGDKDNRKKDIINIEDFNAWLSAFKSLPADQTTSCIEQ